MAAPAPKPPRGPGGHRLLTVLPPPGNRHGNGRTALPALRRLSSTWKGGSLRRLIAWRHDQVHVGVTAKVAEHLQDDEAGSLSQENLRLVPVVGRAPDGVHAHRGIDGPESPSHVRLRGRLGRGHPGIGEVLIR